MVHKVLFWGGFGIAVRLWQLGIEMRPILARESLWVYPLFAGVGGSFGYWLQGVEERQLRILAQRREAILEKRRRRDDRENSGTLSKVEESVLAAAA
ncbi:putative NADH-ubiquinone oxidoreductase 14 kDa subunit [Aspergillus homomorphus CBS 101889]|uniref:NADH-ubiquinone oxidoreductase 14 kDa subunit n=1 Tax=Aspergillus homomorphus (strain CBS 101889) TaxID=1450537 RepID=A0A395HIA7_ASPHC|nr:NADH-ubiquinone oxidoreductase 14 kDa subunit [Aspergillus homomorphus CBS 101889]RAL07642.1 NADH-ubiquinone oxidoreductase 14 kDa subunit [Aspergillus homomorphus CBS 101889]